MKKVLLFLVLIVAIGFGAFFGLKNRTSLKQNTHISMITSTLPTNAASPTYEASLPIKMQIPAIELDTPVEQVGEDSQKRMDVPKKVNDVGWYNLGYKPGEQGSAVIDGHYDTITGAPSVFYKLNQLKTGDKVIVTDSKKQSYSFHVVDKQNFSYDKVPLKQIFATNDKPRLNLITCSGTWDKEAHNYSSRTVVYTVLDGID